MYNNQNIIIVKVVTRVLNLLSAIILTIALIYVQIRFGHMLTLSVQIMLTLLAIVILLIQSAGEIKKLNESIIAWSKGLNAK